MLLIERLPGPETCWKQRNLDVQAVQMAILLQRIRMRLSFLRNKPSDFLLWCSLQFESPDNLALRFFHITAVFAVKSFLWDHLLWLLLHHFFDCVSHRVTIVWKNYYLLADMVLEANNALHCSDLYLLRVRVVLQMVGLARVFSAARIYCGTKYMLFKQRSMQRCNCCPTPQLHQLFSGQLAFVKIAEGLYWGVPVALCACTRRVSDLDQLGARLKCQEWVTKGLHDGVWCYQELAKGVCFTRQCSTIQCLIEHFL